MSEIEVVRENLKDSIHLNKKYLSQIEQLQQENQQLKERINGKQSSINALKSALKERTEERDNHIDKEILYKSVIDEIQEILDYGKAMIEHDKDYDIGYNFLVNAEKINNIISKVKESDK